MNKQKIRKVKKARKKARWMVCPIRAACKDKDYSPACHWKKHRETVACGLEWGDCPQCVPWKGRRT